MEQFQIDPQLFKLTEIEQPFEDLRHVQPLKAADADYGIDLFLFLNMISYIPNASFDLDGKDEKSKHIKKVIVVIHKDLPFVKNGNIIPKAIKLRFRVIPRTAIQDKKLQSNPDRILLSGYSRFLVIPEKYIIVSVGPSLEESSDQEIHNYLVYASKIITNSEYYPYFGYTERKEIINRKETVLKILKLIFKQKELIWRV